MKNFLYLFLLTFGLVATDTVYGQTRIQLFDKVRYYDGYAATVSQPVPAGVIRHRNDLYATKMTDQQLASIGGQLTMNVTIKASCDNYDRIGNVNMALVPKGATTYNPDSVARIEIGRFITPFMNKNVMPDTVPYTYNIENVARLMKESSITGAYDIWIELEVFGVPYAANNEVAGCSGRNDVFFGSLELVTDAATAAENTNVLIPLSLKQSFNNYQTGASDAVGTTKKTININVPQALSDAVLVLITSNHGANQGGEEYNRRMHYVSFDGTEVLSYKPGRLSCEPFRKYNTQGNGIYSPSPRTDAQWQSFSNWCPGDVIDTRIIRLGAVTSGSHVFKIDVPDAVFTGSQGNIPLSLYLQGKTSGTVLGIHETAEERSRTTLFPNPAQDIVNISTTEKMRSATLYNLMGQKIMSGTGTQLDVRQLPAGIYWVKILLNNDRIITRKLVKR